MSNAGRYNEIYTTNTFADVPVGSTFHPFIERLSSRGIIGGYPCGGPGEPCDDQNRPYFRPGYNVTRGQTSKIVAIANGLPAPTPGQQSFEDVPTSNTFWTWIEELAATGAIGGYPCVGPAPRGPNNLPYFRPAFNAEGQAAKIVSNNFSPHLRGPIGIVFQIKKEKMGGAVAHFLFLFEIAVLRVTDLWYARRDLNP